jgi:preprotein translocase subunit SecA
MSEAALLRMAPRELASGRPYVEREEKAAAWHDELALALWYGFALPLWRAAGGGAASARSVVARARACEAQMAALDDAALRQLAQGLRHEMRRSGFGAASVARFFAVLREAGERTLGKRHYDSQLHAGWLLLQGTLAEMATGEGKTFAATLPACAAAIVGLPVHVITVNDYLAARDAETMAPLFAFFGLRCGAIVHGMTREQRRQVYAGDITYCSNKELTFDYLRDRTALGDRASALHRAVSVVAGRREGSGDPPTVLRGLSFAIVDEADSVFIDEARTPLILSATLDANGQGELFAWALARAATLREGADYTLERALMRVRISDALRDRLEAELDAAEEGEPVVLPAPGAAPLAPVGIPLRECAEKLNQALSALLLYQRDQHYVVAEGKVQIVDESTGRVMPDRAWERGLHQMIEAKEGLQASGERATLARITYQRFFRRYLRLAGMTGTATEVAAEIGRVYRLPVARVPLHRPSLWRDEGSCCYRNAEAKWHAVVASVQHHAVLGGRPVLVGTRTVRASEELSARLGAAGIVHLVLNAKQDHDEAAVIARAGFPGTVTVATNMAGRGTDIELQPGVAESGGLHVILTEYHDSPRIDRQLFGRAARQGDPGSGEAIVALDDELFMVHAPRLAAWAGSLCAGRALLPYGLLTLLRRFAQSAAQSRSYTARMASLKHDRRLARMLAFSGRGE